MTKRIEKLDMDKIINAVENNENEYLTRFSRSQIQTMKNDALQMVINDGKKLKNYHKKLKDYIYISDLMYLKEGSYLRWIPLKEPTKIKLTNGGILVDTLFLNDGIQLRLKNNMNRFFQIKFDEVIVFQKLRDQEQIILALMEVLE